MASAGGAVGDASFFAAVSFFADISFFGDASFVAFAFDVTMSGANRRGDAICFAMDDAVGAVNADGIRDASLRLDLGVLLPTVFALDDAVGVVSEEEMVLLGIVILGVPCFF